MSRAGVVVALAVLSLVGACAPMPIPTETLSTPTRPPSPSTATATHTSTPTATQTSLPTLIPAPTEPALTQIATPFAYEHNPRALVVEADIFDANSLTPADMHVPLWRLYGDGLVVFAGASAPLSTGLDAVVRVGHLSDSEIQNLLAYLNQVGFFSLKESYAPRPVPADATTGRISVFLNKVKRVSVVGPDSGAAPQSFADALRRITQTIPGDAQTVVPTDAFLQAVDAGPANSLSVRDMFADWSVSSVRLVDASDGLTVSGSSLAQVGALVADSLPVPLFREGDRVYRVRFSPNVPRAVHLSDWVGIILDAPREFDGRTFDLVGYFRGWNVYGEASGSAPVTRSDWVIADSTGAIYVTGAAPPGLAPSSRTDAWSIVRLTARVVYVRLGTSYLEARRVQVVSSSAPPTPTLAATLTATIAAAKSETPRPTVSVTPPTTTLPTRTATAVP